MRFSAYILALFVALAGFGCSSGTSDKKASKDDGADEGGEDDLPPSVPVPMGILDAKLLGTAISNFDALSGKESEGDLIDKVAGSYSGSQGSFTKPAGDTLKIVRTLISKTFGKDGYFQGENVVVKRSQPRTFQLKNDGGPKFAVVSLKGKKNLVEFYLPATEGRLVRIATVEFAVSADEHVVVDIEFYEKIGTRIRVIEARYDTKEQLLSEHFTTAADGSIPALGAMVARLQVTDGIASMQFVGRNVAPRKAAASPVDHRLGPRYGPQQMVDGDLVALISASDADGKEAFERSFVPYDAATQFLADTKARFAEHAAETLGRAFLEGVVTGSSTNPDCATTGKNFKAAVGSGVAATTALPDSLCKSESLTAAALFKGLIDGCAKVSRFDTSLVLAPPGGEAGPQTVDLCRIAVEFTGPPPGAGRTLYASTDESGNRRIDMQPPTAVQKKLAERLPSLLPIPDLEALNEKLADPVYKDESDFAEAETFAP